jgi:hypothetical protein
MDPLDQRLSDAGASWRQAQPEPPDLDRLVRGLDRHPRRLFSPRAALLLAASLVIVAAVAVAPGVGGVLNGWFAVPSPTATPSPAPTASPTATPTATSSGPSASPSPSPSGSPPSDAGQARNLVRAYETALIAGDWRTAFDLLGPASPKHEAGFAAFASERAAFYVSVAGRYTIGSTTVVRDPAPYEPVTKGADLSRAFLIEVDYPALTGNNAGYDQFVVAPDATGAWKIWPAR